MSDDAPKLTLRKIKRHADDHPGYYHDEEEIKYLLELHELERDAHEKALALATGLKEQNTAVAGELELVKQHADAVDQTVAALGELSSSINKDLERMQALQQEQESLYYREVARYEELMHSAVTLFEAIKHGDEAHQKWLKETIAKHFNLETT